MPERKWPPRVYGWWDGNAVVYGEIPPPGAYVVQYTINNEGIAVVTVTFE